MYMCTMYIKLFKAKRTRNYLYTQNLYPGDQIIIITIIIRRSRRNWTQARGRRIGKNYSAVRNNRFAIYRATVVNYRVGSIFAARVEIDTVYGFSFMVLSAFALFFYRPEKRKRANRFIMTADRITLLFLTVKRINRALLWLP